MKKSRDKEICPICNGSCPCCGFHYRWRPIETAPKDGTPYLATNGKKYAVLNEPQGHEKGQWEKLGNQWVGYAEMKFEPTLWRPLESQED